MKTGLPLMPWAMLDCSSPCPETSIRIMLPWARTFGCTPMTVTPKVSTTLPANTDSP